MSGPDSPDLSTPILIDGGTTNTRAWLAPEGHPVARANAGVGLRDVAVGARDRFESTLRELLSDIERKGTAAGSPPPTCVVAAGMVASSQGLGDVPHVMAPAGLADIASASRWTRVPWLTDRPVLLVAGVRTGELVASLDAIGSGDVMRGEETLCLGLVDTGAMARGSTLLNLGSHWKIIWTDSNGRILSSRTSLSGELVHAVQTSTVLASSLTGERPREIDFTWVQEGSAEARRSGLPRALFCVRLLDQRCEGTAEQRLSFLIGASLSADLDPLFEKARLGADDFVMIVGDSVLATAAARWLHERGVDATVVEPEVVERSMVAGMHKVALNVPVSTG